MFQPLSLFVGLRYIRSRHGKGFAKFISAASTIGIAIGVAVLIMVLSAMNGFEKVLAEKLLSIVPHAELISVNEPIKRWQQGAQQMQTHPEVIAVAPVIKLTGMLQYKAALKAVEVRGVDAQLETLVSDIDDYIVDGKWFAHQGADASVAESDSQRSDSKRSGTPIVLGAGVAKQLGVNVGDKLQVLLPQQAGEQSNRQRFSAPKRLNVEVKAIFRFGGTIDDTLAYLPLAAAAKVQGYDSDTVQGLRIKVTDVFAANNIARDLAYRFNHYVYIYDWTYTQGHLFNDIQLVRTVMFIVMVLVIAVASFNIVSTLIMVVKEKQGDIAILKTMGASHRQIMTVFVMQGMSNGVIGALSGALLGSYFALYLTDIVSGLEQVFGTKFLSGDVYFVNYLPTALNLNEVYLTAGVAMVLSVLATLYPAWQAAKIDPAQVLGQA
ncbi:lipoprotein-releasing ABC transporter permease subunit LolE [Thalassotalea euphylliae]|uniref:Lipoprotein-releasing ABC transporter permease subunit LolE n=1 Tax=Thalassotalea euphylliae TaxID=1655234 RepID=A0A3E0UI36_9GAMM|nr:lipoprotein-releasing ABC transporter permease subunit LolE [Thalassotalea euphylliae]REL36277.1 lipoprotein-releasing ABC transporter permease subunit LolE [Thalassotalea euphylliae]